MIDWDEPLEFVSGDLVFRRVITIRPQYVSVGVLKDGKYISKHFKHDGTHRYNMIPSLRNVRKTELNLKEIGLDS